MANTLQKVTDNCFRIVVSPGLVADGSVTIGFSDRTFPAAVSLTAPEWQPYEADGLVSLQDAVMVEVNTIEAGPTTEVPISVIKTGTTHADFLITVHNDEAPEANTSGDLEIYVTWGGH